MTEALNQAVRQHKTELVKEILDRGTDTQALDADGNSLLHIATAVSSLEMVQEFLDRGLNINAQWVTFECCLLSGKVVPRHSLPLNGDKSEFN